MFSKVLHDSTWTLTHEPDIEINSNTPGLLSSPLDNATDSDWMFIFYSAIVLNYHFILDPILEQRAKMKLNNTASYRFIQKFNWTGSKSISLIGLVKDTDPSRCWLVLKPAT